MVDTCDLVMLTVRNYYDRLLWPGRGGTRVSNGRGASLQVGGQGIGGSGGAGKV